jgi:hypothetical protein
MTSGIEPATFRRKRSISKERTKPSTIIESKNRVCMDTGMREKTRRMKGISGNANNNWKDKEARNEANKGKNKV